LRIQPSISPESKAAAQDAKTKGNEAFSAGRFDEAITHFSAAIAADPSDHIFLSNRRRVSWSAACASARAQRAARVRQCLSVPAIRRVAVRSRVTRSLTVPLATVPAMRR